MITETRLTVEFVLGLISLDACGKGSESSRTALLRGDGYPTRMTMIVWSIIWTLINRGEINSLNLWVQSGIKPRIHRSTFFYPPPLRHPCMSSVVVEKWMRQWVWETDVIQGPQRPSLSKDPHTHQQRAR